MKKYLNKALQFQWFYQAKPAILAALLIFSIASYLFLIEGVNRLRSMISVFSENVVYFDGISLALIMALCLFIVYFFSKGIDKRNKMFFITSGPYNKKMVLINEIFSLALILLIFLIIIFYLGICIYIGNKQIISLSTGYFSGLFLLLFRLLIFGIAIIVFMELFDVLFSNSIIAFVSLAIVPILSFFSIALTRAYLYNFSNFAWGSFYNIIKIVEKTLESLFLFMGSTYFSSSYYDNYVSREYERERFWVGLSIALVLIIVGYFILNLLYKKIKLEEIGKLFTFKWVEKVYVFILCYFTGIYSAMIVLENSILGLNRIMGRGVASILVGITVFFIVNKICRYILRLIS